MSHYCNTKATVFLLIFVLITSCKTNRLPQVDYANNADEYYIYSILNYQDGKLMVKDSIIEDFWKFHLSCIENSPESDNSRNRLHALAIDKKTPYHEVDSVFRVFANSRTLRIFLLVNDIKDTVGFTTQIPLYDYQNPEFYILPDTVRVDNFLKLYNDSVNINGMDLSDKGVEIKIKEIVYKKEAIPILVDKYTNYNTLIKLFETYHKQQQYFKELYAELNFNKKYRWFYQFPIYYSDLKFEVDEEYKSKLYLLDPQRWTDKTIIINND